MEIIPGLIYLTRAQWGAHTDIPRLGHSVNRLDRTHIIFHHTVVIDNDATPNLWESLAEVKAKMRQLQIIRPDLGLDVPYSFVFFLMADGSLIVCEGRGLDRTGAHTHAHNTKGIGIAGQGNYQLAVNVTPYVPLLSRFLGWLRYDEGMENLWRSHPPGEIAYGHRDFASTLCPGNGLFDSIPQLTFQKGGLTVGQYEELKAEIDTEKARQDTRRAWIANSAVLAEAAVGLPKIGKTASAHKVLDAIIAQAQRMKALVDQGKIVP